MSEQRSNPRLQNFEANKEAKVREDDRRAFEDSIYGEAGATDFSDDAKKRVEEADAYERQLEVMSNRQRFEDSTMYYDTVYEGKSDPLSGKSLDELAKEVATARQAGNSAAANYAEEAFFNKFHEYSQKYGWENEIVDESATGQLAVDKNAKLGRDTIDARLERYGKIMYGDESKKVDTENSELTVATLESQSTEPESAGPAEDDNSDIQEQNESESISPTTTEQFENAKQELHDEAKRRAEAVIDSIRNGDEAKADKELLKMPSTAGLDEVHVDSEPVSTDGLEMVSVEDDIAAREGESMEEYEQRHGVDDDMELSDDQDTEQSRLRTRSKRLRSRLHPYRLKGLVDARIHEAKNKPRSKEKSNNRKALIGLGVLGAVMAGAGIYVANKYGIEYKGPSVTGSGDGWSALDALPVDTSLSDGSTETASQLNWNDFDSSARNVTGGEGWFQTFNEMGIPKSEWNDVLSAAGPKLGKLGEAYFDSGAREWRISEPGKLSNGALRAIAAAAKRNGVEL